MRQTPEGIWLSFFPDPTAVIPNEAGIVAQILRTYNTGTLPSIRFQIGEELYLKEFAIKDIVGNRPSPQAEILVVPDEFPFIIDALTKYVAFDEFNKRRESSREMARLNPEDIEAILYEYEEWGFLKNMLDVMLEASANQQMAARRG